ncbi:acetyl-CoA carboxylase alpha subunit [Aeropyrum camini SY1 = JCM 12091]|uniref:Acetyl-CoA carboxylase alpha subunit n=1 Tax=Aeropyrum camini SY1 = JCM 12091 TaxID=1198449 RepID=U3T9Y0_9CREN|nr:acetyl-CoA carboxylase alpha subunit [Aeropyrum camini SY1 = JCM 12091]
MASMPPSNINLAFKQQLFPTAIVRRRIVLERQVFHVVPPRGFEPRTTRSSAGRSPAELRRLPSPTALKFRVGGFNLKRACSTFDPSLLTGP